MLKIRIDFEMKKATSVSTRSSAARLTEVRVIMWLRLVRPNTIIRARGMSVLYLNELKALRLCLLLTYNDVTSGAIYNIGGVL